MPAKQITETFGQMVDRYRKEFKKPGEEETELTQAELGEMSGISGATLSRLKRGEIPISAETGLAIIKALGLKGEEKKAARTALFDYINNFVLASPYSESGSALKELLTNHDIPFNSVAALIQVSATFISACLQGFKAIPPEQFNTIGEFLLSHGVPKKEVKNLKRVYTKDILENSVQLSHLTPQERKRLAALAMNELV